MEYIFEKIKSEDLEAVQLLTKKVIRENYKVFFAQEAIDWFIDSGEADKEITNNFDNCYVLKTDSMILGYNVFFDNFIHIMMIDNAIQRKGLGSKLLQFAEEKMSKNGHKLLKLETFKENKQAVEFYTKNSWIVVNEKQEEGLGVTRIFLEKEIMK